MDKIAVVRVTLDHVEGRRIKADVNTLEEADVYLRKWAHEAPDDGSYDKTDFMVYFADGETYEGRFDLQYKHRLHSNLLGGQMIDFTKYHGGIAAPLWMKPGQYEEQMEIQNRNDPQFGKDCREFLRTYELGRPITVPEEK